MIKIENIHWQLNVLHEYLSRWFIAIRGQTEAAGILTDKYFFLASSQKESVSRFSTSTGRGAALERYICSTTHEGLHAMYVELTHNILDTYTPPQKI